MSAIKLTPQLGSEYENLFNTCDIRQEKGTTVETIASSILSNRSRYQSVGGPMGIPWYFVGAVHNMEASQNFSSHLHNGDPLSARTIHVPAGQPKTGNPPFTWEESARDALQGRAAVNDWSLAGVLYHLEGYNGWGYRHSHPETLTPYLWSFSTHYTSGKFIADGRWSASAVSKQCGAAVILRRLVELGEIDFPDQPLPDCNSAPLAPQYATAKSRDLAEVAKAVKLQEWLNSFNGIFVKPDGIPGMRTSDAYKRVTGSYLPSDTRTTAAAPIN